MCLTRLSALRCVTLSERAASLRPLSNGEVFKVFKVFKVFVVCCVATQSQLPTHNLPVVTITDLITPLDSTPLHSTPLAVYSTVLHHHTLNDGHAQP